MKEDLEKIEELEKKEVEGYSTTYMGSMLCEIWKIQTYFMISTISVCGLMLIIILLLICL